MAANGSDQLADRRPISIPQRGVQFVLIHFTRSGKRNVKNMANGDLQLRPPGRIFDFRFRSYSTNSGFS